MKAIYQETYHVQLKNSNLDILPCLIISVFVVQTYINSNTVIFFFAPDYPVIQPRMLEDDVSLFSNMILKRVTSLNLITPREVKENPAAMVINLR